MIYYYYYYYMYKDGPNCLYEKKTDDISRYF